MNVTAKGRLQQGTVARREELKKRLVTDPRSVFNVTKLSAEFNVTRNTIYSDLEALRIEVPAEARQNLVVRLLANLDLAEQTHRAVISRELERLNEERRARAEQRAPTLPEPDLRVLVQGAKGLQDVTTTVLDVAARVGLIETKEIAPVIVQTREDALAGLISATVPRMTRDEQLNLLAGMARVARGEAVTIDTTGKVRDE